MRRPFTFLLIVLSCSRVPAKSELGAAIDAEIAKGSTIVDLGQLADFEWDEVCFLGPFLRPVDISTALGFKWQGKRTRGGGSAVFVKSEQPRSRSNVTGHLSLPGTKPSARGRRPWSFDATGCVPRDQARFVVKSSGEAVTLAPENAVQRKTIPPPFSSTSAQ